MKKYLKTICFIFIIFTLSINLLGCNYSSLDSTSILRPPYATGEKGEIEKVIKNSVGIDYTLKYPQSGEYRSAIIMKDLDGDQEEEAIALYKPSAELSITHVMFIKQIDGVWTKIGDYEGSSIDISKIDFADIDGDNTKEVLIAWKSPIENTNNLSVYRLTNDNVLSYNVSDLFSDFQTIKVDGESKDSILLVSIKTSQTQAQATLLQYNFEIDSIFIRSSVALDESLTQLTLVQKGLIRSSKYGIFIDGTDQSNTMLTQVVFWDKNISSLVNPLNSVDGNVTLRKNAVVCRDINNDSLIDIPTATLMQPISSVIDGTTSTLTTWSNLDIMTFELESFQQTVMNMLDSYYFIIPELWQGRITVTQNTDLRSMEFYDLSQITSVEEVMPMNVADEILTIQVFTKKDWENRVGTQDFIEMDSSQSFIYAVKLPVESSSDIVLTLEEIKKLLVIID